MATNTPTTKSKELRSINQLMRELSLSKIDIAKTLEELNTNYLGHKVLYKFLQAIDEIKEGDVKTLMLVIKFLDEYKVDNNFSAKRTTTEVVYGPLDTINDKLSVDIENEIS